MVWIIVNYTETDNGIPLAWHNGDTTGFIGWGDPQGASTWTMPDADVALPVGGAWTTYRNVEATVGKARLHEYLWGAEA